MVQTCVEQSFTKVGNNQTDNYLLNEDKLLAEIYGVSMHPSITINGQIYKGKMKGPDVFRAICASFTGGFKPYECLEEFDVTNELGDVHEEFTRPWHDSGRWLLIVVLVLAISFNVALVFAYKKWQQAKTNAVVESQV